MLKKVTSHTKLLPACLSALIVLFSFGFVYTNPINSSKTNSSFIKLESLKKMNTGTAFFAEKKSRSSFPEELLVTIEEQDEDTDDDNNNEALVLTWILYGHNYSSQLALSVRNYSTDCPQPLSVALYILFHSWKNFIN